MEKREHDMEYDNFMKTYQQGITNGEQVGCLIARLAQHFATTNMKLAAKRVLLNIVELGNVNEIDDVTGKQVSVAKANVMTSSSQENIEYKEEETHLKNIENYINSLKNLQKGILNEYSHVSAI